MLAPKIDIKQDKHLTYPKSFLYLGCVGTVIFLCATVISFINTKTEAWVSIGFVLLSLPCLYLVSMYFLERHTFDEKGIKFSTMVGNSKILGWCDIHYVNHNQNLDYFVLTDDKDKKYYISFMMNGIEDFIVALQNNVNSKFFDKNTLTAVQNFVKDTR